MGLTLVVRVIICVIRGEEILTCISYPNKVSEIFMHYFYIKMSVILKNTFIHYYLHKINFMPGNKYEK